MKLAITVVLCMLLFSCGTVEKGYDHLGFQYESLINEIGTVKVLSGGQIVEVYPNAKIIYNDSKTQFLWITTEKGKTVCIQSDVIIELNDD
jgi:hypothetical protein